MKSLRVDQHEALQSLREAVGAGQRRIVMQAPTGFGKTLLSAALVENALAKKKKVLFTVPMIGLIDQTVEMFYAQGIRDVGVIQAQHHMTDWSQPVQIASVQTLMNRPLPDASVALVDEVHKWFEFYAKWFCKPEWSNVPIIGLSATPWTKGLGSYFGHYIKASTTQELIDAGLLSPFKVYAPSHPDLSGVRTVAGDYHEGELSAKMQEGTLVADAVDTWLRLAEGRPTLCYGVDRVHAKHLQEKFNAAGVPCAYQDAYTDDLERKTIKRDFHEGRVKVVCNVGTLTVGIDWDVRCISLCRPTKSDMLFVQIVGRGLRTANGKDHCLILDHSDNHQRLGFVTDIDESYQGLHVGKTPAHENRTEAIALPKECPQCAYLKPPRMAKCPACGFVAVAVNSIKPEAGELRELKPKPKPKKVEWHPDEKKWFYAELKAYGRSKNYNPHWADNQYRAKFGVWPNAYKGIAPASRISDETKSWIKSRQIAYAQAKAKARREMAV
jgi:DNA repair protein RadD